MLLFTYQIAFLGLCFAFGFYATREHPHFRRLLLYAAVPAWTALYTFYILVFAAMRH